VPVVSNQFALPEVAGSAGYIFTYENLNEAKTAVQKALQDNEKGPEARRRIVKEFSVDLRKRQLKELIQSL
jgi:glycosyltransferase involved in cell wall biosynthesis